MEYEKRTTIGTKYLIVIKGAAGAGEQENGGCHVGFVARAICLLGRSVIRSDEGNSSKEYICMFLLVVMWVGAILIRRLKGRSEPTGNVRHSHFVKS